MILQPALPLFILLPLILITLVVIGWLCFVSCRVLKLGWRLCCLFLTLLAMSSICALFLNPGQMEQVSTHRSPVWLVGLDTSASMTAPSADDPHAVSRIEAARDIVRQLGRVRQRDIRWFSLADGVSSHASAAELASVPADGNDSRLSSCFASCLESLRRQGQPIVGAILISDGRDTQPSAWQELVSQAGTAGCPIHVVPIGGAWQAPDFIVGTRQPFVLAYPGVETPLTASVRNVRMGKRQVAVELLNAGGEVLKSQVLDIADGEEQQVLFHVTVESAAYTIRIVSQPGESRNDNNAARITVRSLSSRIRVFLVEGAPYWDSKFLAQYLRNHSVFDVRSVHRLRDNRFYHINTGDSDSAPTEVSGIPTNLEGLMRYDIIVLGKGMEMLLGADSVRGLQAWVREQGGVLVMARGRCYSGKLEGMSELEPFTWGERVLDGARLVPATAGVDSGLFGGRLPDPQDPIWSTLPELEDIVSISDMRAETRVLARAGENGTPLLSLMPCGLGAVACINGEGLWKWDFYPDAWSKVNMYREFWRRFLPWVQTAAEFMPGFDLSLHPDRLSVAEGEGVTCMLGWRGMGRPQEIFVQAVSLTDGQVVVEQKATLIETSPLPRWVCSLGALPAGEYLLRGTAGSSSQPECRFTVRPPITESDNLNANAGLLAKIAEATLGQILPTELETGHLETIFAMPDGIGATEESYRPVWAKWQVLVFLTLCLGLLWFIRRWKGLP